MKTGPSNRACWPLVPGTGRVVVGTRAGSPSGLFPLLRLWKVWPPRACTCGLFCVLCVASRSDSSPLLLHPSFVALCSGASESQKTSFKKKNLPPVFYFAQNAAKLRELEPFWVLSVCLSDCSFVWAFLPSLLLLLLLQHLVDRRTSGVLPISGTEVFFLHLFVNMIPVSLSSKMVLGAGSYGT